MCIKLLIHKIAKSIGVAISVMARSIRKLNQ